MCNNLNTQPPPVKICQISGNTCNICFKHCEDGDVKCPEGHQKGKKYNRLTHGITCHALQGNTCSVCNRLFDNKLVCPNGHEVHKVYYI
jgi:hypothetical protein